MFFLREEQGRCIASVTIIRTASELNGLTEHIFEKSNVNSEKNFNNCGIMEGSYVVVSTDKRPAVATGFVTTVSFSAISISLDRYVRSQNFVTLSILFECVIETCVQNIKGKFSI